MTDDISMVEAHAKRRNHLVARKPKYREGQGPLLITVFFIKNSLKFP